FLYHKRVRVFNDHVLYNGPNRVRVVDKHERETLLETRYVILATGSRPYRPADVDFNHPRIYDSDTILSMTHTPRKLIIYGAGVIGCEYASIFSGLATRVDLVNNREHLLDFLDAEISDALAYHLREQGTTIRHMEEYVAVEPDETGVTLVLKSGKRLRGDALLWSNGRSGNSNNLGLDTIGIEADNRGHIKVDERYQTE